MKMSNHTKNNKSTARKADDGQHNNQRAVANLEKRISRVEQRTVTAPNNASRIQRFADSSRRDALGKSRHAAPSACLTQMEADYHHSCKTGQPCMPLTNHNIEPSIVKQKFTGRYLQSFTVGAGTSVQITVTGALNSNPDSNTPKAFSGLKMIGVGAAPTSQANAGPTGLGADPSGCVSWSGINANDSYIKQTTSAAAGYSVPLTSVPLCPFAAAINDGRVLRWQIGNIRVKTVNMTKGSDKGGLAYVISPTNTLPSASGSHPVSDLMTLGYFKTYEDMEIKGQGDGWVVVPPRDSASAFHYTSTATTSVELNSPAAYIILSNSAGVYNNVELMLEVDWVLAGQNVRGIGSPHVVPAEVQDRVNEVHAVMRSANILPSEQSGKEHIPAAMSLAGSPSLQAVAAGSLDPRAVQETTMSHLKRFVGKHAAALASAGAQHLVGAAAKFLA
jgi:hypothetical protein